MLIDTVDILKYLNTKLSNLDNEYEEERSLMTREERNVEGWAKNAQREGKEELLEELIKLVEEKEAS